ncbi:MAG TPA: hypothetical protein VFL55_17840 [Acetobacteraceae bacterium]|nr:hypothetical protein [Acetobacteraceae bacterium]
MAEPSKSRSNHRGLWSSVVLQALEDIESQPITSVAFADAEAFFTRSGPWGESRAIVADFLDVHRDELETIGRRFIAARHAKEAQDASRLTDAKWVSPLKLARLVARRQGGRLPHMPKALLPAGLPGESLPPNTYTGSESRPVL